MQRWKKAVSIGTRVVASPSSRAALLRRMARRAPRRRGGGATSSLSSLLFLLLLLLLSLLLATPTLVRAKPRPKIPDNLDNVWDDEEDDDFKSWGEEKFGRQPVDGADDAPLFDANGQMDPKSLAKLQERSRAGPQLTFVKLHPDPVAGPRSIDEVNVIGERWATLMRSGGVSDRVYGIDTDTMLVQLKDGRYMDELREFLWMQEEVREFEWNSKRWLKGNDEPEPPTPKPKPDAAKKEKKKKKKKSEGRDGGGDGGEKRVDL